MQKTFFTLLASFVFFVSTASAAQATALLLRPLENHVAVTEQEAARINEIFLNRVRSTMGWSIVDSAKVAGALAPGQACDQDCLASMAQKLGATVVLSGAIEPTKDAGKVKIEATLYDASNWREVQKESEVIGPDIEKDLGKVSSLAKMFDPSSLTSEATPNAQPEGSKVSTTANWILGGTALLVLLLVVFTLSSKNK